MVAQGSQGEPSAATERELGSAVEDVEEWTRIEQGGRGRGTGGCEKFYQDVQVDRCECALFPAPARLLVEGLPEWFWCLYLSRDVVGAVERRVGCRLPCTSSVTSMRVSVLIFLPEAWRLSSRIPVHQPRQVTLYSRIIQCLRDRAL